MWWRRRWRRWRARRSRCDGQRLSRGGVKVAHGHAPVRVTERAQVRRGSRRVRTEGPHLAVSPTGETAERVIERAQHAAPLPVVVGGGNGQPRPYPRAREEEWARAWGLWLGSKAENTQRAYALAICATFARQAGFEWAGSLALGGGGMVNGVPLAEGGGKKTMLIRKSLDLAAEALAQGQPVPQAAQDRMAKPIMPAWAYRLMGNTGWLFGAKSYGRLRLLWRKPYLDRTN